MNNKLEELRENKFLTKKELAKILGISDSIYSRWEKGKDIMPTKRLYEIANYYSINADYILGLSTSKKEIKSNTIVQSLFHYHNIVAIHICLEY